MYKWIDYGNCEVHSAPQGSDEWLNARKECVITGSQFGSARLHITRGYNPPDKGPIVPNEAMKLGNLLEGPVRDWFKNQWIMKEMNVVEMGLARPKTFKEIGCSVDGLILCNGSAVGIIEIKTTKKFYASLFEKGDASQRISPWHYDQMQGGMAVLGLPYCYYIVYEHTTNKMHVEKVLFDKEHWVNTLEPALRTYVEKHK